MSKVISKSPLGLVPKYIRQKQRFIEVCEAIVRYYNEKCPIPLHWIEEYNDLCKEYKTIIDECKE